MSPLFSSRSLLLILVALRAREVLGQCQEGVECPAPDSPPENRPDPEDCSSYFLCVGGCAIHQKVTLALLSPQVVTHPLLVPG